MKVPSKSAIIQMLLDTGVGTLDPGERLKCCGMVRDIDGFCQHRRYHPIHLWQYIEDDVYER